jgi:hypothetical protein
MDTATLEALGLNELIDDTQGLAENICEQCGGVMCEYSSQYVCENCSNCTDIPTSELRCNTSRTVVVGSGFKRKIYNVPTDSQEAKRRVVLEEMRIRNRTTQTALHIPEDILVKAAALYSEIQKNKKDQVFDSETGELIGEASWVHRGSIKEEILASLIYFITQSSEVAKKKRDVAKFMNLHNEGFSRGEDIVRKLVSDGVIQLDIDIETPRIFAGRYLEALNLDQQWQCDFVVEVVEYATVSNWCLNCQLSSRVAGAIYMLVRGVPVNRLAGKHIPDSLIETTTDGTRKNTFRKIVDVVIANPERFKHIFDKYSVGLPAPVRTRAKKK